ncbi:hypothetical protein BH10ACT10_BH10ACT10_15980 [soil metagenome]
MTRRFDARPPAGSTGRPPTRRTSRVLALLVALLVLAPIAATAVPIEGFAPYEPQTNCSPNAKPGTTKLSEWLQKQYPGSGSLGISRSCKDGGVSEHKEGRAFDWAVSVYSVRDRAYVADFMAKLLATDAEGNTDALARRMGIMYFIWNDQIYSSYYGFRARPYKSCAVLSTCGDTLRHRNHVHISLSRAGGNGTTSWYTGASTVPTLPTVPVVPGVPTTPTVPVVTTPVMPAVPLVPKTKDGILDLRKRKFVTVTLSPKGAVKTTGFKLRRGYGYTVTASGTYGYGTPAQVADASCRWSPTAETWTPYPGNADAKTHGSLNLLVNRRAISAKTCRATHVCSRTVKPSKTGPLTLQVANKPTGATGSLRVLVSRTGTDVTTGLVAAPNMAAAPVAAAAQDAAGLVTETVAVPAASTGVSSTQAVAQGASYRITVGGAATLGTGVQTDGRCLLAGGTWWPQASLDPWNPGQSHGRLYVDGVALETDGGSLCTGRTHTATYTATRNGVLDLALWDPLTRSDDSGQVTVTIQRLTPVATPAAAPAETVAASTPWTQRTDTVTVNPASATGTLSTMKAKTGQKVTMTVHGTLTSAGASADAACVATSTGWSPTDPAVLLGQELLELWADGQAVAWRPVTGTSACAGDHAYTAVFTATKNGSLRFGVLDADYRDNAGSLAVSLAR